jgi:hypothetical protein
MSYIERCLEKHSYFLELSDIRYLQQYFWSKVCNSQDVHLVKIYQKLSNDFQKLEEIRKASGGC